MRLVGSAIACSVVVLASFSAFAQKGSTVSSSAVAGRVVCDDSNGPARFGRVFLKSTDGGGAGDDLMRRLQQNLGQTDGKSGGPAAKPLTEKQKRAQLEASRGMNRAMDMLNASTIGLNGEYRFEHVKPGSYYVHILFPGYIDPLAEFTDDDLSSSDPAVRQRIAKSVSIIKVSGTDSTRLDLRLTRGAAVSGRVLFDDGSPAVGWTVMAVPPKSPEEDFEASSAALTQALMMNGGILAAKTDDVGRYRLAGLPPADYILRATLNMPDTGISANNLTEGGSGIALAIYSGDSFSRSGAKPFSVGPGENRAAADLTVPFHKLHDLSGHVYAKSDGHALNSGQVMLTSKADPAVNYRAAIREDGSFRYEYLPPNTYLVKVDNAADAHVTGSSTMMGMTIPKQDILHKYESGYEEVVVGNADVDTVRISLVQTDWVPPAKQPGKEVDAGAALGGLLGTMLGGDDAPPPAKPLKDKE